MHTRRLLALGTLEKWPEPLHGMLAEGRLRIDRVATLHEAAAELALKPSMFYGLLISVQDLGHRELSMLVVFRRHLSVPLWLLPGLDRRVNLPWVRASGALPWEDTKLALEQIMLQKVPTADSIRGSKENPQNLVAPEKSSSIHPKVTYEVKSGEEDATARQNNAQQSQVSVGTSVVAGYHKKNDPSHLSDDEIRALLGPVD